MTHQDAPLQVMKLCGLHWKTVTNWSSTLCYWRIILEYRLVINECRSTICCWNLQNVKKKDITGVLMNVIKWKKWISPALSRTQYGCAIGRIIDSVAARALLSFFLLFFRNMLCFSERVHRSAELFFCCYLKSCENSSTKGIKLTPAPFWEYTLTLRQCSQNLEFCSKTGVTMAGCLVSFLYESQFNLGISLVYLTG